MQWNFLKWFNTLPVQTKPDYSWYKRPTNTRISNPSRSFLDTKESWWVFDHDGRIGKTVPGNYGIQSEVFTDRHFVMFNDAKTKNNLVFRKQITPTEPKAPAKLTGWMYLLLPDQIRVLDEYYQNQVQSIRTRTRILFPDFFQEHPKKKYDPMFPTIAHAWMYFDRATEELSEEIPFDLKMCKIGLRDKARYTPVPTARHHREHIKFYFDTQPLSNSRGYIRKDAVQLTTPTMSQVS